VGEGRLARGEGGDADPAKNIGGREGSPLVTCGVSVNATFFKTALKLGEKENLDGPVHEERLAPLE